ncbi:MAG TPA: ABC transporter substrate-binding protein [Ilumatobacteraceae bacterium]|nr:ABC transporter substrate-binding protein [Ilumatobacteraceae bacterium]
MRWLTILALGVALTACSNPVTPESGAVDDAAIDVFGPYRGAEADNFAASLRQFEEDTGIAVNYTGSADFVSDLRQRVESGLDAPDIAVIPQPGLIAEIVDRDLAVPLDDATVDAVAEHYGDRAASLTAGLEMFVAPYRVSPKSLVWYRPDVFEQEGWSVPETIDELVELVDRIQAGQEGSAAPIAPWCFAMASGTATGWAATDWVEDLVARNSGLDVYDRWAAGALPWDAPAIRDALSAFDALVVRSGRAAGGLRTILQIDVARAGEPLFADPPGCAMYKQASFAEAWFPDGTEIGRGVDVFVLPGADADSPAPMIIGADSLVQFSDRDDVDRLMQYLVSPDGGREWARRGGYLSGRTSIDVETYHTDSDRQLAQWLTDGRELRFDASDGLPPEIGSGLLWREITRWTAGSIGVDEFVATIDAAMATPPG